MLHNGGSAALDERSRVPCAGTWLDLERFCHRNKGETGVGRDRVFHHGKITCLVVYLFLKAPSETRRQRFVHSYRGGFCASKQGSLDLRRS
ncbi:hypothetical protein MLD38_035481 [Melastoma candidum]|uniref:Uncharacterized protein n=1 Tax=Melastoma candidum TaxID=119954 RepID=A0ACB9LH55_9MYRT|nr:hypothetical protein MLD38_035481 [Melastoma candidum]